ncbi:MAG: 50S ribosomal protein L3 [Candidatus Bipolaricaulota bacterium]
MALALMGKKVGMTQWFDGEGRAVGATVVWVEPSVIVQVKEPERHGYGALQLGYGEVKEHKMSAPVRGQYAKAGLAPRRHMYEARVVAPGEYSAGQEVGVDAFSEGDRVDVSGVSKGRGFAGTIKRHGFSSRPKSHGHKMIRRPGTAGPTGPRKIMKGKRMPGHFGAKRVTMRNIEVLKVDTERGLLVLRGSVPGHRKGLLKIRKSDA